jgi:CRISPR/Cas system-associated exonuclease Cas4 (RecB family)
MRNLIEAVLAEKAKKIKRTPCNSNRASSLGYFVESLGGCLRRGVYERTKWTEKDLHDARTQLIFDEGNNQEAVVLRDLAEAGIQIIEQQGAWEERRYEITGHLDGVYVEDGVAYPVEIKSMSPHIFTAVNSFDDFKKKPWTRAYMAQMMLYMLSKNVDKGIFLLKNKSTGELKQITVDLDYELAEDCLKAAELINSHVRMETLPNKISDIELCKNCPYKTLCCPGISFGEELKIEDDPMYESRIAKYLESAELAKESEKAYELIRERAKATAGEKGILNTMVGKFLLTGKKDSRGAFRFTIENMAA